MTFIQISGLFVQVRAGRKDFLLPMKMPQLGQRFWKGLNSFQIPKKEIKKANKSGFLPSGPSEECDH